MSQIMWNRWINNYRPIGCQIGARHVRMAQVQERRGTAELLAAAAEIPAGLSDDHPEYPQALSDLLRKLHRGGQFRGRRIVSSLPNHRLMQRMMRMAPMPAAELIQAAHWKAASELGLKPETFKAAILELGRSTEAEKMRIEIAVIAAECARLEQHVEIMTRAGLKAETIDASTCAAVRCLHQYAKGDEIGRHALVLELGHSSAVLAVAEAGRIVFLRALGEGTSMMDQLLADMLSQDVLTATRLEEFFQCHPVGQESGDWPFPQIDPQRAARCMSDAQCMYARDLARGVTLSLHYLTGTLGRSIVPGGIVIGSRFLGTEALDALSGQTGIRFCPARDLFPPAWERTIAEADGEGTAGSWLAPIGLSLYEEQSPVQEAA